MFGTTGTPASGPPTPNHAPDPAPRPRPTHPRTRTNPIPSLARPTSTPSLPSRLLRSRLSQSQSATPSDANGDVVMEDGPSAHPSPPSGGFSSRVRRALSGIIASRRPRNGDRTPSASGSGPSSNTSSTEPAGGPEDGQDGRQIHSFLLWVVGGLYAHDSPVLAAPGLFTGNLGHEDLWSASFLLGDHFV